MFFKSAHSSRRTLRSGHCQASDSDTLVIVAHNNIILQLGFWMCVPACFGPTQHLQMQGICLCVLLSEKLEKQAASVGSPASGASLMRCCRCANRTSCSGIENVERCIQSIHC